MSEIVFANLRNQERLMCASDLASKSDVSSFKHGCIIYGEKE